MRNNIKFFLSLTLVCILGSVLFDYYLKRRFENREILRLLHIKDYTIVSENRDYPQMCIKIIISKKDGEKIFNSYPFLKNGDSLDTKGLVPNTLLKLKRTNWYYLKSKGLGLYAYIIISLSPDKKQAELFESFSD